MASEPSTKRFKAMVEDSPTPPTVPEHKMNETVPFTLYWGSGNPFAWGVMLVMETMSLPFRSVRLSINDGKHKTPQFLKLCPRGQVPVLIDHIGNVAMSESVAIVEYLHLQYAHCCKGNPMLPSKPTLRARTLQRLQEISYLPSAFFKDHNVKRVFEACNSEDRAACEMLPAGIVQEAQRVCKKELGMWEQALQQNAVSPCGGGVDACKVGELLGTCPCDSKHCTCATCAKQQKIGDIISSTVRCPCGKTGCDCEKAPGSPSSQAMPPPPPVCGKRKRREEPLAAGSNSRCGRGSPTERPPFLVGKCATLADLMFFPWLAIFVRLGVSLRDFPALQRYYTSFKNLPLVQKTWPPHWLTNPSKLPLARLGL